MGGQTMADEIQKAIQGVGTCARCKRKLTNPHSVAKSLGPVCYAKSGGGVYDADLKANEKEWARREKFLKAGGEIDLGVFWDYPDPGNMIRSNNMRVSIRYNNGAYEAYGCLTKPGKDQKEIIFARGQDLKIIYREAVAAGPTYTAMAYRARREAGKEAMRQWRQAEKERMAG